MSGIVSSQIAPLPVRFKGDIVAHDGSKPIRVSIGSNGQVLTADSSEASGLKWATIFGSGVGIILKSELITLTLTNITNKQLTLLETPYPGSVIQLIPVGGIAQVLFLDYEIDGAVISWDGLGLDGILSNNDKIQIFYQVGV